MPSMWWRRCGTGVPGKVVRAARSGDALNEHHALLAVHLGQADFDDFGVAGLHVPADEGGLDGQLAVAASCPSRPPSSAGDRKSTRLNSSHGYISYAVFCLKKKKKNSDKTMNYCIAM